jgi:hypothetical protein
MLIACEYASIEDTNKLTESNFCIAEWETMITGHQTVNQFFWRSDQGDRITEACPAEDAQPLIAIAGQCIASRWEGWEERPLVYLVEINSES